MKIVLIGDTLFNKEEITLDSKLKDECCDADIVLLNLEGPITNALPQKKRGSALSSKPTNLKYLKELNVNVAILGNNHIMDHGEKGLIDTKELLHENDILFVGAENIKNTSPWVLEYKNLAIFSYAHNEGPMYNKSGAGPVGLPDIEILENDIREYKKNNVKVIFNYHGGEEFYTVPWPRRRGFLNRIAEAGADIVFSHHSHSVQPLELISGKVIVYSPGNFYMDTPYQRERLNTNKGIVIIIENENVKIQNLEVDYQAKNLKIVKTSELTMLNDLKLDLFAANQKWIEECKQTFNKPVNRKFLFSKNKFMVTAFRYALFIKKLSKKKNKIRDIDILLSSLPIVGVWYANSLYKKGYNKFKF